MLINTTVRPEVAAMALAMESRLQANEHKGGWRDETFVFLAARVEDELRELREAIAKYSLAKFYGDGASNDEVVAREDVLHEAADVANFAMMIADNCGALRDARSFGVYCCEEDHSHD